MSQEFLEKLRDYLNERLKDERLGRYPLPFQPFEIDTYCLPTKKWEISVSDACDSPVAYVTEEKNGTVCIYGARLDKARDYISELLVKSYRFKFAKAGDNKEEREKVWEALRREREEACKDYINRRNLEKHLKKPYRDAFIRLLWFDEIVKEVSKKHGVELSVMIDKISYDSTLVYEFDGSNMDEERKFEEIKKGIEALVEGGKIAMHAYGPFPGYSPERYKEYLEFRKVLLEKYKASRKRKPS
ncbi:MAG: hypothetical protein N3F08_01395 [Crenarchaeota archaeon]|nr:hypothetical protein [Thermoproteota archaeon]